MFQSNLAALQVVFALMMAPCCVMVGNKKLAWLFACIACLVSFVIAMLMFSSILLGTQIEYYMGNWQPPFGIEYRIDAFNIFMITLVSFIGSVVIFYAKNSVDRTVIEEKQSLFYAVFLLCFAGLLGILATNDAFNIYVFLEISSLATYALIGMGKDRRSLFAAYEYLILGTIGATFILIAVGMLYMITGTLNITDLGRRVPEIGLTIPVVVALVFFVVGLALKIAMFPLHLWLTNAYTNAPSFASAFLSATATKVSIYVLVRILFSIFGYHISFTELPIGQILHIFAVMAIIVCSIIALFQHNVKRILAYSSIAQIGYIILAISLGTKAGIAAAIIFIANHAVAKAALFMATGCVVYKKGSARVVNFNNIARQMPFTMAAFVVSGFSLIGIPLTAGFVSKIYIIEALYEQQMYFVIFVVLLSSLVALFYIWRVVEVAYFGKSEEGKAISKNLNHKIDEAPLMMLIPLWFLVIINVVLGVYTLPTAGMAGFIAETLFK